MDRRFGVKIILLNLLSRVFVHVVQCVVILQAALHLNSEVATPPCLLHPPGFVLEELIAVLPMFGPGGCVDPGGDLVVKPGSPDLKASLEGWWVDEAMPGLSVDAEDDVEVSVDSEEKKVRFDSSVPDHIGVLAIARGNQQSFRRLHIVAEVGQDDVWAAVDGRVKGVMQDLYKISAVAYACMQLLATVFHRHQGLRESTPKLVPV